MRRRLPFQRQQPQQRQATRVLGSSSRSPGRSCFVVALLIFLWHQYPLPIFLVSQASETSLSGSVALLDPRSAKQDFSISAQELVQADLKTGKNATRAATFKTTTTSTSVKKPFPRSRLEFDYHNKDFERPTFDSIVTDHKNNVIVGDLQFLLDFAIVGHAKCGTSTMMEWLGRHPQVLSRGHEIPHLSLAKLGLFAKNCYNLDPDPTKLRAYKNPTDVQNLKAIRLLREYFPRTALFIGIRHPIWWFESFYNHRIQNTGEMPPAKDLQGVCVSHSQGVCGERANFHLSLARFGKTNYTMERDAFTDKEFQKLRKDEPPRSPNPIFLYDTQQLADADPQRSAQFRQDVQEFLGLTIPLPPVVHYSPGKTLDNATLQAERNAQKLHICDDQHSTLRASLLDKARKSAYYIRKYFMHAPDVYVSSPSYFEDILDSYSHDPCLSKDDE